ncbi:MAG TPA: hypothetical protein VKH43_07120 [Thermoanaerobaculia bacterium]|nr:hypothetical protein [Thermoanaerobaculia bacterium]
MRREFKDPKQGAAKPSQRPTGVAVAGGEKKSRIARTGATTELTPEINRSLRAAVSRSAGVRTAEEPDAFESGIEPDSRRVPMPAESARVEAMAGF